MPPELPALSGPAGSEIEVARRYLGVRGKLLDAGLGLKALRLDPRGSWELELSNGINVRLGRRDVEQRLARLVEVVTIVVSNRLNEVAYIDMRYSNGFAVGWKRTSLAANTLEGLEVYV
jgi:cell division protein FtsQ